LVTGATGFIGRHLVADLAPTHDVTALVRVESEQKLDVDDKAISVRSYRNESDIGNIFEQVAPELTIHLATHFPLRGHSSDFRPLIDANITFGAEVASAAAKAGSRFILTSSYWQHFESAPYAPVSLYAASKEAFRTLLQYYIDIEGLEVVDLCLFDTYGRSDDRGKLLQLLLQAAIRGDTLKMSQGTQLINLLDVRDVCAGIRAALLAPIGNYELRSADWLTVRQLVAIVGDVVGRNIAVEWGALDERPREMRFPWVVAPLVPQWTPTIDLRRGISEMLAAIPQEPANVDS